MASGNDIVSSSGTCFGRPGEQGSRFLGSTPDLQNQTPGGRDTGSWALNKDLEILKTMEQPWVRCWNRPTHYRNRKDTFLTYKAFTGQGCVCSGSWHGHPQLSMEAKWWAAKPALQAWSGEFPTPQEFCGLQTWQVPLIFGRHHNICVCTLSWDILWFLFSKNIFLYLGPNFFHWVCEPEIIYVVFSSMSTKILMFLTW